MLRLKRQEQQNNIVFKKKIVEKKNTNNVGVSKKSEFKKKMFTLFSKVIKNKMFSKNLRYLKLLNH